MVYFDIWITWEQIVSADKEHLLIIRPHTTAVQVEPLTLSPDHSTCFPWGYVRNGKFNGAQLISADFTVFDLVSLRTRVARWRESGETLLGYVFMQTVGTLLGETLLRLDLELRRVDQWDLARVKKYVSELIERNPDAYVHETGTRLRRQICTSQSIEGIRAAIMGNPIPYKKKGG